jgi:uncharacterized protein
MTNTTDTTAAGGNPVGWFEIGTGDPEAARRFYGDAFGWTFEEQGPYSVITTGPGHPLQGGIQDTRSGVPEGTPMTYAVPYVVVPDVGAACDRVESLGGKVLVPATTIPTGLTYAHVADPDGNPLGLFKPPASG